MTDVNTVTIFCSVCHDSIELPILPNSSAETLKAGEVSVRTDVQPLHDHIKMKHEGRLKLT